MSKIKSFNNHPKQLSKWYLFISWLICFFYFGRARIIGQNISSSSYKKPRLILCSHRNGAIDGYNVLNAFPNTQFLVSIQLLRNPMMRLMFSGIPVVREKDQQRYGIERNSVPDPVTASCQHLKNGGELAIFPEGTSEWGFKPQPYQRGAARIIAELAEDNIEIDVIPVGLHYVCPDAFRAPVEIYIGQTIYLPPRLDNEEKSAWIERIYQVLTEKLNEVSVNCGSLEEFQQIQMNARERAQRGESYAEAFLAMQNQTNNAQQISPNPPLHLARAFPWDYLGCFCLLIMAAPALLGGYIAGRWAKERNTVTFFRVLGGFLFASPWWLLHIGLLSAAFLNYPLFMLGISGFAILGWFRWAAVFQRSWK